jgi:hypothetical protein
MPDRSKLLLEIGIFGKESVFEEILALLENRNYQTNKDLIPLKFGNIFRQLKARNRGLHWRNAPGLKGIRIFTSANARRRGRD